ncbi:MAG TPA: hypothetical protein PL182_07255 [Pseudobdellovibrionaceae bacterium]|nr:hypothetical protein [Pseudobdellovibrionaceae bacterium]
MASCPNCHQTIEILNQHMGALFNCPHCRAVFFVDWNGQPEAMAEHEPEPPPSESPLEMPAVGNEFQASPLEMPSPEEAPSFVETPLESPLDTSVEAPVEIPFEAPPAGETFTPETSPTYEETPDASLTPPESTDSFMGGESFAAPEESAVGGMADVLNYGNQENSTGPLTYTVLIAGLELAETFEKLKEALTDSRFNWESDEVMAQVQAGRLELKGLNPTKASILINRIKYLPIEVSWKQEVYGGTS